MPECDYCRASFEDEETYLTHLENAHADELGPIDKRRVGGGQTDERFSTGPIVLGTIFVIVVAVIGYVIFVMGDSGPSGIGQTGSAHYHGTIEMTVLGEPVDFSREQYQLQDDRFHFEGDGRWHAHATGVTLGYGMDSLGINVTEDSVGYEGTTYSDSADYTVTVEVNGQSVSPDEYVLQDNDRIRIMVNGT